MTDDTTRRLEEIEERCSKATEGPWFSDIDCWGDGVVCACVWNTPVTLRALLETEFAISNENAFAKAEETQEATDARFMAAARSDIPWLLSQVRSLRSQLEEAERERERLQAVADAANSLVASSRRFEMRAGNKPRTVHHQVGTDEYRDLLLALCGVNGDSL